LARSDLEPQVTSSGNLYADIEWLAVTRPGNTKVVEARGDHGDGLCFADPELVAHQVPQPVLERLVADRL
jgi:hypothetical protein